MRISMLKELQRQNDVLSYHKEQVRNGSVGLQAH